MARTIELKYPVKVGELTVTQITIGRPKTKDFIALGTLPYDCAAADAKLLSSVSGVPEAAINQIDIEDWAKLRFEIQRIWVSYFSTTEYNENPTKEEQAAVPRGETAST